MHPVIVALVLHLAVVAPACRGAGVPLTLLEDFPMAVCLDGSPAGFYHRPASSAAASTKWMLYFEGGGWCWDAESCHRRSLTSLGSSKSWPRVASGDEIDDNGPQSANCSLNPTFCEFHLVFVPYCDGNSFSGLRVPPLSTPGGHVYLRGRFVLEAALTHLLAHSGLANATEVVVSGCSAGGLATFLHADDVRDALVSSCPGLRKFGALPLSGFFLDHDNIAYQPVYPSHMRAIFALSNATDGVSSRCVAAQPAADRWRCNFAQHAFAVSRVPTFVQNSNTDMWQACCILDGMPVLNASAANVVSGNCSAVPGYGCITWGSGTGTCSPTQIMPLLAFRDSMMGLVRTIRTFSRGGNVAHINACYSHCEVHHSYGTIRVAGLTIAEAVHEWWTQHVKGTESVDDGRGVVLSDCNWSDTPPYFCNPTCPGDQR